MNCADFDRFAPFYLYGILPPPVVRATESHLSTCARCDSSLKPLRTIVCREIIDTLADYLENTLPEAERRSLEAHLAVCPDCLDYLRSYQDTIRLTQAAFDAGSEPACDLPDDLVRAVLAARKKTSG